MQNTGELNKLTPHGKPSRCKTEYKLVKRNGVWELSGFKTETGFPGILTCPDFEILQAWLNGTVTWKKALRKLGSLDYWEFGAYGRKW